MGFYGDKYTERGGEASITGAVNTVDVTHLLFLTPRDGFPQITAQQTGQGNFWVSAKDATTFTISFDNQPGAGTWYFDWYAEV
jgi:hypothetical protein